ncbi:MAG: DUF3015 domain-containing protein [Lentisphaeria bacterium]|nr:DUF3015 domain-containing protein [Lentisphaeria bacterium]
MKKMLTAMACTLALGTSVYAGPPKDNCGCGLGSIAFEGKEGLMSQTLAGTTNALFCNQLFGITTGTLGCEKAEEFMDARAIIKNNMDQLAIDISNGNGEVLESLATALEIDNVDMFANQLQDNFDKIYTSDEVTSEAVTENILGVAKS